MSEPKTIRQVTPRHYQAVGGLALAAIFLIQLEHSAATHEGTLLVSLFIVLLGAVGLLYRVRLSPMLVLCAIAVPILAEQYNLNQFDLNLHAFRPLDIADLLLCMATLTYLIAQYRLHGLWFGVLPADARLTAAEAARSEESMSPAELLGLIVPIPAAAFLAQIACLLLRQQWTLIELPPRWRQLLAITWSLLLIMFLAAHAFRYWRRLQMDRATALLMLQDVLWNETRGEQRRINRWIAWQREKVKSKK